MNQTQSTKSAGPTTQPPDVGEFEMGGIAQDDVADESVARKQHSDLASEFPGNGGNVFCEFRGYDLLRRDAPSENTFQGTAL